MQCRLQEPQSTHPTANPRWFQRGMDVRGRLRRRRWLWYSWEVSIPVDKETPRFRPDEDRTTPSDDPSGRTMGRIGLCCILQQRRVDVERLKFLLLMLDYRPPSQQVVGGAKEGLVEHRRPSAVDGGGCVTWYRNQGGAVGRASTG